MKQSNYPLTVRRFYGSCLKGKITIDQLNYLTKSLERADNDEYDYIYNQYLGMCHHNKRK